LAVAEERHFGRAAERLGIKQPPLSQQIQALERDLGVRLFDRSSRRVTLTAAGVALRERAAEVLAAAESARETAQLAGRGDSGRLVLGFVGSAALSVLPPAVRRFRRRHPLVELALREMTTGQQVAGLHQGVLDVGLVRPPLAVADDAAIETVSLGTERLVAVLPADHPLARQRALTVEQLADQPFVLFPRELGPGLHDQIVGCCRLAGFTPDVVQRAVQMHTIVAMVAAGIGVALVPEVVARFRHPDVVYRELRPHTQVVSLALAHRRDHRSPVVENFVAIAREFAAADS
jgi:DNA-binding transcriptional LysR family regulator